MDQFKAIESVRMSAKHAKRKKEMGGKIDPGRARLGRKNGPTCTIYIPGGIQGTHTNHPKLTMSTSMLDTS